MMNCVKNRPHQWIGDTCTVCGVAWNIWAARTIESIPQLRLAAAKWGAEQAASQPVKAYPNDVQGCVMESGFDKGCFEKKQVILTFANYLKLEDLPK